jgi:hypothetical protein
MSHPAKNLLKLSSATSIRRFGAHLTWIQEPDIFFMRLEGTLSGADLEAILKWQNEWAQHKPHYFVVSDLSHLGTVTREARRVMTDRQDAAHGNVTNITYGATFAVRVMADMATRARKALGMQALGGGIFVDTEAQARAEIEKLRKCA